MAKATPKILDGQRGPMAERNQIASNLPEVPELPPAGPGTLYQSTYPDASRPKGIAGYSELAIQVTAPLFRTDPITGQRQEDRPIVAKFEHGYYRNEPDPNNPDKQKIVDKWLQNHKQFGMGKLFWLADDFAKIATEKALNDLMSIAQKNQAVMDQLRDRLSRSTDKDFDLPAREQASV